MPSFFSELPSVANIASTSSEQVGQAWAAISPVLVLLAVPVALVILGLIVWAVKELLAGTEKAIMPKIGNYNGIYGIGNTPEEIRKNGMFYTRYQAKQWWEKNH